MTQIPEGAQRSEDGNYWWDGAAWQLIDPAAGGAGSGGDAGGAGAQQSGGTPGEQEGQAGESQEGGGAELAAPQIAASGESGPEAQAPDIQVA